MKKRMARKGPNAGKYFYGCSRWPNCNGIININGDTWTPGRPTVPKPKVPYGGGDDGGEDPGDNRPYTNIAALNFPIELEARPRASGYKTVFMDGMALPKNFFGMFNERRAKNQTKNASKTNKPISETVSKSSTKKTNRSFIAASNNMVVL